MRCWVHGGGRAATLQVAQPGGGAAHLQIQVDQPPQPCVATSQVSVGMRPAHTGEARQPGGTVTDA